MTKILVVEDEPSVSGALVELLQAEGWGVELAETLAEAEAKWTVADLVLLDWMLPDGQGLDLLRVKRNEGSVVPVLFVTARTDVVDRVVGLEVGADDYITKPFAPRELVARIGARLRTLPSAGPSEPRVLESAGVRIDLDARSVFFRGQSVGLAKMEFELLLLLVRRPGRVFTRDEILTEVWGYERMPTTRTVDTHVLQLRQKLDPSLIESVRGVGYRWVAP